MSGRKLVALRVRRGLLQHGPETRSETGPEHGPEIEPEIEPETGDGVALAIEFLKFELSDLNGSLQEFDHLRWNGSQKLKAVYSRSQKVITLFELELPIFGALALQKIEI